MLSPGYYFLNLMTSVRYFLFILRFHSFFNCYERNQIRFILPQSQSDIMIEPLWKYKHFQIEIRR